MPARYSRLLRWLIVGLLAVFALIQLIPADRSNPPVQSRLDASQEVMTILRRACFDCHSHETQWPWYGYVAPVSWWIAGHVNHARGDLNFSEWPAFDLELQALAFRDIEEQVESGEMPLPNYLILHPEARLSDADREALVRWARSGY